MALNDNTIQELIADLSEVLKDTKKDEMPQYSMTYYKGVEDAEEIKVHAYGMFPANIISDKAPNETEQEFEYRRDAYQSQTKGVWDKMIGKIGCIWARREVSVEDEDFEQYLRKDYPGYDNFFAYFEQVITNQKINEPNAIAVVTVQGLPTIIDLDENGEMTERIDQSARLQPVVKVYPTARSIYYKDDVYALCLTSEVSTITKGGKPVDEGLVYALIDTEYEYRIYQVGEKNDYQFEIMEYYRHGYDDLPAWRLKGFPHQKANDIFYTSYFSQAVPYLNKAAFLDSTLDSAEARCNFPIRVRYEEKCPNDQCQGVGWWLEYDEDGKADRRICSDCNGTGNANKFSPHRDMVINMPEKLDPDFTPPFPPLQYVSPPTDILTYDDEKIDRLLQKAGLAVNMDIQRDTTSETATKHKIDLAEFHAFLLNFSNEIYDLMEQSANVIGWIRYGQRDMIIVHKPNEFSIKNSQDIADEFGSAIEKKLPSTALKMIYADFIGQKYPNDLMKKSAFMLRTAVDPLIFDDAQTVVLKVNSGLVPKWQAVLHNYFDLFVQQVDIESETAKDQLIQLAKDFTLSELPTTDRGTTQSIFDGLAG